jgi:hypothetical protein
MTTAASLGVIEQLDESGHVLRCERIHAWPFRLGRSLDCDFVTADEHVAASHVQLDVDAQGGLVLTAAPSLNGVQVLIDHHSVHVPGGQRRPLAAGQPWRAGLGTYRVRLGTDPLPPETPLAPDVLQSAWQGPGARTINWSAVVRTAAWGAALVLWLLFDKWLDSTSQTRLVDYLKPLIMAAVGLGLWVLMWVMASKVFTRRLLFLSHLRTAMQWGLSAIVVDAALTFLGFMFEAPALSRISLYAGSAFLALMIARHLGLLLPARRRWVGRGMALLYVLGVGGIFMLNQQQFHRYFREPYMATMGPPALRVARPQPVSSLLDAARKLQGPLTDQARQDEDEDDDADSPN